MIYQIIKITYMPASQMSAGWASPPLCKPQAVGSQGRLALPPGITNSIM